MPLYAIIDHLLYRTFLENITYFDFGRNHGKSIYQSIKNCLIDYSQIYLIGPALSDCLIHLIEVTP